MFSKIVVCLHRQAKIFIMSAAVLVFAAVFIAQAASDTSPYNYLRIFYYREGKQARESLFAYPSFIDVLAPQSYSFDASGKLIGKIKSDILAFTKKHGIRVMPLVTNGNFNKAVSQAILDDVSKQDLAIDALISEAEKNKYWGWQFDFEQMDISYRDKYSAFIQRVAEALRKNNLILSVAVIAQVSENPDDYPNDIWQKVAGVYNYKSLGVSADFISVMTYDDPESTGPVVEYPWLRRVLDYSTSQILPSKISMGISLYYWQWNNETGARLGAGGRQGIYNVFKIHKVSINYDTQLEAAFLTYFSHAKQYIIWYENARSIAKKIELIAQYKLKGFSAWALGLELPTVFNSIRK